MAVDAAKPLRADAERNRRKLLAAAHAVFAARGLDAGVDEIAREAGVGMGTLYRRFPTKEALVRSEEHTSELQSRQYLVCRLLLEKKKNTDETPSLTD